MDFSYSKKQAQNCTIYNIAGRLMEKDQAEPFIADIESEIAKGNAKLVLNLKELDHMNSSGINVFIAVLTKARNAKGETVLSDISEKVKKLFLITKLNTVFTTFDDDDTAIKFLNTK